jgi:predicted transcriptional regulator
MRFSKLELRVIEQLAKDINRPKEIAKALGKSLSQIYKEINSLEEKYLVKKDRKGMQPIKNTHVSLLLQLLLKHPNLANILSDSGLEILIHLLEPKKIEELPLKQITVYRLIRKCRNISLVRKENKKYFVNKGVWPDLFDFLVEYKKYYNIIDTRVPLNAEIYYKNDSELVYSYRGKQDATYTAFSAYQDYGIRLFGFKDFYYLPKKKLTLKQVFQHSIYVAEKERDIQYLILVSLLYLKYKKELANIKNKLLDNLKQVLDGKKIEGYPSLQDIKDRAEVYDIKI